MATLRDEPLYTVAEVAVICMRRRKTIYNLLHLHHLPRQYGYIPKGRYRQRILLLTDATARRLRQLTLERR